MWIKALIFVIFALILASLARGLFCLVSDEDNSKRTVNALTYRVILSVALILFLILSASLGWIQPHTVAGGNELMMQEMSQ